MSKLLDLSLLGAEWYFNYNCNILELPYNPEPFVTCSQSEVTITGKFDSFVVDKISDIAVIDQWFQSGSALVVCPFFKRLPIVAGQASFVYEQNTNNGTHYGRFMYKNTSTPFVFASMWFDDQTFTDFKLEIKPVEKGYQYRKIDNKTTISDIPFTVVPHKPFPY